MSERIFGPKHASSARVWTKHRAFVGNGNQHAGSGVQLQVELGGAVVVQLSYSCSSSAQILRRGAPTPAWILKLVWH